MLGPYRCARLWLLTNIRYTTHMRWRSAAPDEPGTIDLHISAGRICRCLRGGCQFAHESIPLSCPSPTHEKLALTGKHQRRGLEAASLTSALPPALNPGRPARSHPTSTPPPPSHHRFPCVFLARLSQPFPPLPSTGQKPAAMALRPRQAVQTA